MGVRDRIRIQVYVVLIIWTVTIAQQNKPICTVVLTYDG